MADIEVYMEAKRALEQQIENAIKTIDQKDKKIKALQEELETMYRKVLNTEKDRDQMRDIMTQNITETNSKINDYAARVAELQAKLHISEMSKRT